MPPFTHVSTQLSVDTCRAQAVLAGTGRMQHHSTTSSSCATWAMQVHSRAGGQPLPILPGGALLMGMQGEPPHCGHFPCRACGSLSAGAGAARDAAHRACCLRSLDRFGPCSSAPVPCAQLGRQGLKFWRHCVRLERQPGRVGLVRAALHIGAQQPRLHRAVHVPGVRCHHHYLQARAVQQSAGWVFWHNTFTELFNGGHHTYCSPQHPHQQPAKGPDHRLGIPQLHPPSAPRTSPAARPSWPSAKW